MRTIALSMLVAGGLLLGACGSPESPRDPTGGEGGEGGEPAEPDAAAPGGRGGGGRGGSGGARTAGSGGGGSSGADASTSGTGGAGGGAPADAGASDAAAAGGSDGPLSTGMLGPGSADDSPPLVLPGSKLIFDGKTLTGWMPCNPRFWSVKDGAIDGNGSGNNFCLTADDHDTFRLTGKSRMVKDPSNHAGICFWGNRSEGGGGCLQITPVSGSLWDYGGGGGVRTLPRTRDYTKWNFFELLVDLKTGKVDIAVEGQAYPTYTDRRLANRKKGPIGLQLHAQPNEVQYKDLALEDNPTVMKLLTAKP
jgi:hypothetical protein